MTLPVEFDASLRARQVLLRQRIVTAQEAKGVNQVLIAAAATYVAAAVTALMQFAYWALRAEILGRSED